MQSSFLMRSLCIFPSTNWNEKNRVKLNSREGECSIPLLINSFFGSMIRDETCPVLVHYLLHNTNSLRAKTSNSWTIYHSNKSLQFNLSQLICNGVNEQLNVYEECSIDSWTILKNRKRIAMWRNRSSFRFKSFYHCTIDSSRFTYSSPTKINKLKIRETGHERERWPRNIETGTAHALFYWRLSIRRVARYEHRNKTQRSNFHETPLSPPSLTIRSMHDFSLLRSRYWSLTRLLGNWISAVPTHSSRATSIRHFYTAHHLNLEMEISSFLQNKRFNCEY